MMAAARREVLLLYKSLLRESRKFAGYNYRTYAVRRVQDAFRENKSETDPEKIQVLLTKGYENLEVIKRQVIINQLYKEPTLVIEQQTSKPS